METIIDTIARKAELHDRPDKETLIKYNIRLGLRDMSGIGVRVGVTSKGDVQGYDRKTSEDCIEQKVPVPGKLIYCGYDAADLVDNYIKEKRFGFEETTYLLLTGELPTKEELAKFNKGLSKMRKLPNHEKIIIMEYAAHDDHMSGLHTAVSSLHKFDKNPNSTELKDVVRQCLDIIAKFPVIVAYNYQAKTKKIFIQPEDDLSSAENFLYLLRGGKKPTKEEAQMIDAIMILLAEHGGGNNSTFATRVVTSSRANTYMAISTGIASLSGYLHGGAAEAMGRMMEDIKRNIKDWDDEKEIESYLTKLVKKQAGDKSGTIYGTGHAVYTISDPRVQIIEDFAEKLSKKNDRADEFLLYKKIKDIAPKVLKKEKGIQTCTNVDFYTGFVYDMLGIPIELYTPIFAMSRAAGWCAHRIEELVQGKLIRPAYVSSIKEKKDYIPPNKRNLSKEMEVII